MSDTVLIIPCSGIGKSFGSISRDATYGVVEELKKGETDTICLSLLVADDEDAECSIKSHRCISVDGCPNGCAKKTLEASDAKLVASFSVVNILRDNRSLKPNSVTFLDEDGRKLSRLLAEKIALKVDELNRKGVVS
ncbi:putative zinc-binding protein [Candidatus Bathyarchaeota archaeon]|nr:putative zinc-binding protein [Candidatus Bathyarchaeota archaeon]